MKIATTRRIAPSILLAAALLALSPAANAAPPEKGGPVPNLGPFDLPAGVACEGFPLRVEGTGSNANVRTFKDRNGEVVRILQTGRGYTLTYTNLDTLESVTIRPTGSNRRTVENANGTFTVTETGTAGIILFPTDNPMGPSTTQYYGRIVYTLAPDGSTLLSLETTGTSRDICAELA
jgi:hypothetical protein